MNLIFFLNLDSDALIGLDEIREFLVLASNQNLPYQIIHIFIIHQRIKSTQKSLLVSKKKAAEDKFSSLIDGKIKFFKYDPYPNYKTIVDLTKGSFLFFIAENFCEELNKVIDRLLQNGLDTNSIRGISYNFLSKPKLREVHNYELFLDTYNFLKNRTVDQEQKTLKQDSLFNIISQNNNADFIKAKNYNKQLLIIRAGEDCLAELIKKDFEKINNINFLQYDNPTSLHTIPTKANNLVLTNINPIQNPELADLRNYLLNHGYFSKIVLLHFQNSESIVGFDEEIQNYLLDINEFGSLSDCKAEILFAMYSFIHIRQIDYYPSETYEFLLIDNKLYSTLYKYLLATGKVSEFDTTFWYHLKESIKEKTSNLSLEDRIRYVRTRENYLIKLNDNWEIRFKGQQPISLKNKAGLRYLAEILSSKETDPDKIYTKCNPTRNSKDAFTAIRKAYQKDLKDYLNKISVSTDLLNYLFKTGKSLIYFNDAEKKIEIRENRSLHWDIIK